MTKSTLENQVKAITKILTLWPTCPIKSIEAYIQDTLGAAVTRSCIQEAKQALGLLEPKHEQKTLDKMKYARFIVLSLVATFGATKTEKQLISDVGKALLEKFDEHTNHRLLSTWVHDALAEAGREPSHLARNSLVLSVREEMERVGLLSEAETRQKTIL